MKPSINYSIYLVTDEKCLHGYSLLEAVEAALQGGITLLQYRGKDKSSAEMYTQAVALKALADKYKVPLIINDRLDIALAVGAAGVHLGQDDLPCKVARSICGDDFIIGVSAHTTEEAKQAFADGADYLGSGAVFGSNTKLDAGMLGVANLAAICSSVTIPVVGIGGINAGNYRQVLAAGANGAAIVSSILGADNIKVATAAFRCIYDAFQQKTEYFAKKSK